MTDENNWVSFKNWKWSKEREVLSKLLLILFIICSRVKELGRGLCQKKKTNSLKTKPNIKSHIYDILC